jgi:multiple sugar transport system permease protein
MTIERADIQERQEPLLWRTLSMKVVRGTGRLLLYATILAGSVIFIMPFAWMLSTSVKPQHLAFRVPIVWIPPELVWSNYTDPFRYFPFLRFFGNTFTIALGNVLGHILISSMVAFGFARIRFWGRDVIFLLLLSTMMLPGQVTLIPLYLIWSRLKAINTFWPLILPAWLAGPYNVFLLRQYFMTVSTELDDAARMDGCGFFSIYARILMPLAKPALGVVAIQTFTGNWNAFLYPLLFLNKTEKYTIALGLRLFQASENAVQILGPLMAMTTLSVIPLLILFSIAQARFIQGIVITGIKG